MIKVAKNTPISQSKIIFSAPRKWLGLPSELWEWFCFSYSVLASKLHMFDIRVWAENLTKDVFTEYKGKYSFWPHGFKVFYSPVKTSPKLMIISYQPGGTKERFDLEDHGSYKRNDFKLPALNAYVETDYPMAKKVKRLFAFEGGLELLSGSVVFPLIFFRAPSVAAWKRVARKERKDMEDFSLSKVKEIIETIKPKTILIFGIETYDKLKKSIFCPILTEEVVQYRKNERVMVKARCAGYEIIATIHPSGARISREDFIKLRENLRHQLTLLGVIS